MDFFEGDSAPSQFRTTAWSIIAAAQNPDDDSHRQSIEYLCKTYWKPVYYYIRRKGTKHEQALDLAQDYFTVFLDKSFVESAKQDRGKFRTFILTTLSRFLANQYRKNKNQRKNVPIGIVSDLSEDELTRHELSTEETAEDEFNRTWARSLIDQTLEKMEQECITPAKRKYYEIFVTYIEGATDPEPLTYKKLSDHFDMPVSEVTNAIYRGRNIFQKLLREEVRQSVTEENEIDEEIKELRKYFG